VSAGKRKQGFIQSVPTPRPTTEAATHVKERLGTSQFTIHQRVLRQGTTQPRTKTNHSILTVTTTPRPAHQAVQSRGVNWDNLIKIDTRTTLFPSGLTVGSLNAQSVRNKTDLIRDIVLEHDIDILSLTETWLTTKDKDDVHIKGLSLPGYEFHHMPRKGNRGYGGVAVLHKANIKVIKSNVYKADSFENMQIKFNTGSRCLDLVTLYRPPPNTKNKLTTTQFFEEFSEFLQERVTSSGDLLMVGDLNFHLDKKDESTTRNFTDLLDSFNIKQHVDEPTHMSGHALDVIMSRDTDNLVQHVKVGDMITDHRLLLCNVHHPKPHLQEQKITTRKLRSIDLASFRSDIAEGLGASDDTTSVSDLLKKYESHLSEVLNKHAPAKEKSVVIRPQQPWFSDELHLAKSEKRKAERLWRRTGLTVHREIFNTEKVKYNKLLTHSKASYFNQRITECGNDSKALSQIMNELLFRQKTSKLPAHGSAEDLANRFSTFFKEKIDKIRDNLPDCSNINLDITQPPPATTLNFLEPTTEEELWKIISKSPAKSCMLDPIPTWLIKECKCELLPIMTSIINSSLQSSQVPASMKSAVVTPLLKKSTLDPEILKNYRPVSNLSYISKLLETVVARRLTDYMTVNNLHEDLQSAYKSGHSTETALIKVQNDILTSIDQHGVVILVMLDLSAAFDTIDHDILFDRMENTLGITGPALDWFRSYLSGRTLRVKIGRSFSELLDILYSVPQGSVLGPLLFLIYLLPLGKLIRKHGLYLHIYADDTQLYISIRPISQRAVDIGVAKLEACLTDIYTWMSQNKLKLNADKTEVLVLATPQQRAKISVPSISVNGEIVQILSEPIGNLGAVFDPSMNMSAHVTKVVKSANYHLHNIGKARKYLTEESTKLTVVSLVTSRLDYCNGLLYGITLELVLKLQRVQNNAARVITLTKKHDHISPVLKDLHWLPIAMRIQYKILLLVYKCKSGTAPSYLKELLTEYNPSRTLRSATKNLLCEPRTNMKTYGDRAFCACAPKLWNQLPNNICAADSVPIFKRLLKTHLFKVAYDH
jgi:exonuclease III